MRAGIRSHYLTTIATCVIALSSPRTLHGQLTNLTPDTSTPLPGTGRSYIQNAAETVDPLDGSLSIRINVPIANGRGLNIPFSFAYDTNATNYPQHSETVHYSESVSLPYISGYTEYLDWKPQPTEFSINGWSYTIPYVTNNREDNLIAAPTGNETNQYAITDCVWFDNYIYSDPGGGRHNLGIAYWDGDTEGEGALSQYCPKPQISPFQAGPYVQAQLLPDDPHDGVLVQNDSGTVFRFPNLSASFPHNSTGANGGIPDQIVDRNGNTISIAHPGWGRAIYTDTVGRTALSTSGFGNNGDTVSVASLGNPYIIGWETVNYAGLPSNVSVYPVDQVRNLDNSNHCESGIGFVDNPSESVISTITLPNGQAYGFLYDTQYYGFVKQITYPTGGTVTYHWGVNPASAYIKYSHFDGRNYIYVTNDQYIQKIDGPACEGNYDKPAIVARDISYDGKNVALHEDYSYTVSAANNGIIGAKTTVVTAHDMISGNVVKTTYNYVGGLGQFAESSVEVSSPTGSVEVTTKEFQFETALSGNQDYQPSGTPFLGCEQVSRDGVFVSLRTITYAWALPLTQTDYSSGSCTYNGQTPTASGTIARTKSIIYANLPAAGEFPRFDATHAGAIMDRPSSVVIQDGSGNPVAETDYQYDEGTVSAITAVQHDEDCYGTTSPTANCGAGTKFSGAAEPASVARGNATTVTQKCFPLCSDAVSRYTYDETGQATSYTDPKSNPPITYSYIDSGFGGSAAGNSNAYVTQVTRPATNGVQHITKYSYDYGKGLMMEVLNENSQPTDFGYEPFFNRLQLVQGPANTAAQRPSTTYTYTDGSPTSSVAVSTIASPDPTGSSTTIYDGMGNATQTQHSDPQGTVVVDATYDGFGNVDTVTNPYRPADTVYTIKIEHDVLNRPWKTTEADGSFVTVLYSGLSSAKTNELGYTWTLTNDTLGRLVKVVEPSSLQTDYSYDLLNNLKTVSQYGTTGDTARSRGFTYDSLSRLITATNPETGTICYGVWSGTNCINGYDANGNLLYKTDARGITTNYGYDFLNRITSKGYTGETNPDGSPSTHPTLSSCYLYDSDSNSGGNVIGRLVAEWTQSGSCPSSSSAVPTNAVSWKDSMAYDPMGRLTNEGRCAFAPCGSPSPLQYAYDLAGNLTYTNNGLANPQSPQIGWTNSYDAAGRLSGTISNWADSTHPATLFQADATVASALGVPAAYSPFGGLAAAFYGVDSTANTVGLSDNRSYDSRLRLISKNVLGAAAMSATTTNASISPAAFDPTSSASATVHVNCNSACGQVDIWIDTGKELDDLGLHSLDVSGKVTISSSTFPASARSIGSHTLSVLYLGNGSYASSLGSIPYTVTTQQTTVDFAMNPAAFTTVESPQLSIHVSCNAACGQVSLSLDGNGWIPPYDVDGNGNLPSFYSIWYWPNSNLTVGRHTVTAHYLGNSTYAPSSKDFSITINPLGSQQTSVGLSMNPSTFTTVEDAIALVHVGCNSACGQVSFTIDGNGWVTWNLDSNGNTSADSYWWPSPYFTQGAHTLTANYLGNSTYSPSSQSIPFTVNPIGTQPAQVTLTTTALTFSRSDIFGATAHVGCSSACGQVQIKVDGNDWVFANLDQNGDGGNNTYWTGNAWFTPGQHTLSAHFLGNSTYAPTDSAPVTVTVTP